MFWSCKQNVLGVILLAIPKQRSVFRIRTNTLLFLGMANKMYRVTFCRQFLKQKSRSVFLARGLTILSIIFGMANKNVPVYIIVRRLVRFASQTLWLLQWSILAVVDPCSCDGSCSGRSLQLRPCSCGLSCRGAGCFLLGWRDWLWHFSSKGAFGSATISYRFVDKDNL